MTNIYRNFYLIQDRETPKLIAKFDNLKDAEIVAFSLNGEYPEHNFYVMSEGELLLTKLTDEDFELDENYIEV